MRSYALTLSAPDEAGSGGATSGGGGIPNAGPAPTDMPEQQPAGATPYAPPSPQADILPEEYWSKHVPYETADGTKTAPVREIAERLRRQNVQMNNILTIKKRLESELEYIKEMTAQQNQTQPPPYATQPPPPPVYPADPYEDDQTKPIFDYLRKQQEVIDGLQREAATRKQREEMAARQEAVNREVAYHTGLLRNEMAKYPSLKADPDADVAIITEYNRLSGLAEYEYNAAAAAADAVKNYYGRQTSRVDAAARARLEQIRVELEKNKNAGVQGGGGMSPVPDPSQQKITDWSMEGRKRAIRARLTQAKTEGAFGKD